MSELAPPRSDSQNPDLQDIGEELGHFPLSKPEKKRVTMEGKNVGHWNPTEKLQYLDFLKEHRPNFLKKQLRRTDKIFKEMSKYIETRAADQCRSHHQKMEKKYGSFDAIIEALKDDYILKIVSETEKVPVLDQTRVHTPLANESNETVPEKSFIEFCEENNFLSMNLDNVEGEVELQSHHIELLEDQNRSQNLFDANQYFII